MIGKERIKHERGRERERERERERKEKRGLTACSNKGESATCIPAAHNALLSCPHASLPFSHCPARSLFPPRASPTPYETLIFFLLPTHTAQVYIRAECLVARCTEGQNHRFFFAAAPRVFRSIAQPARFPLLDAAFCARSSAAVPSFSSRSRDGRRCTRGIKLFR